MGRFSATVHIKDKAGRMKLINTFCEVMKKRGFVLCSEDEAALSYLLAFGEGGWVTLANEEYKDNPQKAYDDSREMAAALKTSAFSVEVVDSDFALLKLSDPNGGEDEVVVGDGSGYGIEEPTRGERQYWEKLLADGKTWEQFSETAAKNEVFVEDVLAELAGVLGIEPYYIDADHDEVMDKADENKNITAFYFKKAAAKVKSLSLNAAFVKVFGEALEPLGFKKIKYPYPYFLRIVGGEVIHIITYTKWSGHPYVGGFEAQDYGQYDILCMVKTIYSTDFDFPTSHLERYSGAFLSRREIYGRGHIADFNEDCWNKANEYFPFKPGDGKQMLDSFKGAFNETKHLLLPALDSAVDFKSFLDFEYKFKQTPFIYYEHGRYDHLNRYEGLLHVKVDTCDSYLERIEKINMNELDAYEKKTKKLFANDLERLSYYLTQVADDRKKLMSNSPARRIKAAEMFNDKEWCKKALEELERRKKANTEKLRSYGLEI